MTTATDLADEEASLRPRGSSIGRAFSTLRSAGPRRLAPIALLTLLVVSSGTGCRDSTDEVDPVVVDAGSFTSQGGCENAVFWAANRSGTMAVYLSVPAADQEKPYRREIDASSVSRLELQRGAGLREALCNDAVNTDVLDVDSVERAVAGTVTIEVSDDQAAECGLIGKAHFENVEFADGSTLASLDIETHTLGCHTG